MTNQITWKDVARQIEGDAVAATLRVLPKEMALSSSLSRSGHAQNLSSANRNPDERARGGGAVLLRADTVPMSEGGLSA